MSVDVKMSLFPSLIGNSQSAYLTKKDSNVLSAKFQRAEKGGVQEILNALEVPLSIVAKQALNEELRRSTRCKKDAAETLNSIYDITSELAKKDDHAKIFTAKVLVTAVDAEIFIVEQDIAKTIDEAYSFLEVVTDTKLKNAASALMNELPKVTSSNLYKNRENLLCKGGIGLS